MPSVLVCDVLFVARLEFAYILLFIGWNHATNSIVYQTQHPAPGDLQSQLDQHSVHLPRRTMADAYEFSDEENEVVFWRDDHNEEFYRDNLGPVDHNDPP